MTNLTPIQRHNARENRYYLQALLNPYVLPAYQWRKIEQALIKRGLRNPQTHEIQKPALELVAKIKRVSPKFSSKIEELDAFFEFYAKAKASMDRNPHSKPYKSAVIQDQLVAICIQYGGYVPSRATITSWFNRHNLTSRIGATFSLDEILPVIICAYFSRKCTRSNASQIVKQEVK